MVTNPWSSLLGPTLLPKKLTIFLSLLMGAYPWPFFHGPALFPKKSLTTIYFKNQTGIPFNFTSSFGNWIQLETGYIIWNCKLVIFFSNLSCQNRSIKLTSLVCNQSLFIFFTTLVILTNQFENMRLFTWLKKNG